MDLKTDYLNKFQAMQIRHGWDAKAQRAADVILHYKVRYLAIEDATGVPWWFTGILHYRESGNDVATYLGNGQSLDHKTTQVPKGRGPFKTFEAGAIDALEHEGFDQVEDWSIGNALVRFEMYNGMGYHRRGLPSPYLWSGSQYYSHGKYTADGHFSASVTDPQLGCAVLLRKLMDTGGLERISVHIGPEGDHK
jgi:lysozyme family protein